MHTIVTVVLTCIILLLLCQPAAAFGAGDIPDFAYLNDKAYRHGDIENVLANLAKSVGGAASSGGLLGIAASVLSSATGGSKFSKMDVKRVYFGNWLRDYSQAMDIAGLSKLTAQTLVTVVTVLGFMTFGFATAEFEVTADRLGVYLPIEHIDNPKGYAEKEGDAREFHPKLRPPVNPEELDIDSRTGMKNYIANEGQSWDTSSAHVRRTLQQCIEYGRRAGGQDGSDQWEAFRLLGTALHTLEDLLAHSNWCELALRKLGHEEVFCHVGDGVMIDTPNGPAPPLVTGTFGSADFMHSVLGEGMDHLSEASVSNLTGKMDDAKSQGEGPISSLKSLLSKIPSSGDSSNEEKMEQAEDIKKKAYNFNPDDVAPEDIQQQMWQILEWRDGVYRDIVNKIEMIPGLSELMDELTNALNAYVFTVLEPVMKPMLQQATGVLQDGSKAVIDTCDQYEVFNSPDASDPSHSILSKDHFGLILNEPAGKIAQVVVEYSVNLIVKAWYGEEEPDRVIDLILEMFHHPYFATGNSEIQRLMMDHLERWIGGLGSEGQQVLQALTKESVREGKNKRLGSDDETQSGQTPSGGYGSGRYEDVRYKPNPPSQPTYTRYDGQQREEPERRRRADADDYSTSERYRERRDEYGGGEETSYEESPRRHVQSEYGSQGAYRQSGEESYDRERQTGYGGYGDSGTDRRQYTAHQEYTSEGREEVYGGSRQHASREEYPSGGREEGYGGRESYKPSYDRDDQTYGGTSHSYQPSYEGGDQRHDRGNQSYSGGGESYGREEAYGGGNQSYDGGNRSHRGRESYGDDAQSYGDTGRSYGRSEEPSFDTAGGYSRDGDGAGRGYQGEGSGYSRERSNYGGDSQQVYGREDDSETFGAEGLSLEDNGRRHVRR